MPPYIAFIESSGFTRRLPDYLADDDYRRLQAKLASNPEMEDLKPAPADFARCVGQMPGVAKDEGVGCGLSITTLHWTSRSG